jgi:hypothetical protein
MGGIIKKSFGAPDEARTPDKTRLEVVDLGTTRAARIALEPGWRWSECIKPIAQTASCEARHLGTVVSGHLHVRHNDGTELDLVAGDAYVIEPGHDAWVSGNEPFVAFEFESKTAESYADSSR